MTNETAFDPKVQEAIKAALENNWEEALRLNQELVEKYADDVETINRLARACGETGDIRQAKKLYQKVLKLDSYNAIAEKNLKRLASMKKGDIKSNHATSNFKGDIFLEESGKTTTVILEDIAMPSILAQLRTGDKADLAQHRSEITVIATNGKRIGKIEASLAKKIADNLRTGSKFDAFIKSVSLKPSKKEKADSQVAVFVRETYRSPKVTTAPFPSTTPPFTPYVREDALKLLSNQAPVPTEADDSIEEVEISQLPSAEREESLEELAEKEHEESERFEEEQS